jgi:membrane protein CcdC involved in cytochrome C biogenesis
LISICTCIVPAKNLYYIKILGSTSFLVFTLIIIYLEKFDITSAFISNQIISVILIFGGLYLIVKIKKFYLDGNSLKTYYKNLIKPAPSHILGTVSTQLDIWLLLNFASFGATGAYLAFRILELPFKGLLFSLINISTTKYDWTNQKLVSNFTNKSIFILIVLLTITLFFQDLIYYIINLLIGNDYTEYFWMLKYVLYVSCLSTCLIVSMNSLLLSGMISKYYNIQLIVSFIKIVLLLVFFKILGIKGIFLALIIANTLGILLVLILINNLNFKIFKL